MRDQGTNIQIFTAYQREPFSDSRAYKMFDQGVIQFTKATFLLCGFYQNNIFVESCVFPCGVTQHLMEKEGNDDFGNTKFLSRNEGYRGSG